MPALPRTSYLLLARMPAWPAPLVIAALAALAWNGTAQAQTAPTAPPAPATAPANAANVPWAALSAAQKQALAPLANTWVSLSDGQRRKWMALAQNYAGLSATDRDKLHSRMVEWAALTPKDRELARLNFAQTKSVAKPERAANWEAYQALSPEEKKKLADSASTQPAGAALAPKPANRDKLTPVPVTRRTPDTQKASAMPQPPVNRNTLLPQTAPGGTGNVQTKPP